MTKSIKSLALLLAFATVCLADGFTDDNQTPYEPFVSEKGELFRFSRSALKGPKQVKYEQQQQVENDRLTRVQQEQQVDLRGQNVQQLTGANELPAFSGGVSKTTSSQMAVDAGDQQQQHQEQQKLSSTSSTSSSASKKSSLAKTITTTTTTTTTTQNNQDQPQMSQIKEVHVHTVPLSEAVHYANYVVMPSSKAAQLEESSSSSSSSSQKSSSSSTTSETEQVAEAPSPTVIVNPAPAAVAPDCVLSRIIVQRPVTSQLVVQVPSEVQVSRSSSSRSSKIIQTVAAEPQRTVYRSYFVPQPVHILPARVVASPVVPVNDGAQEEHHSSEQHSSRRESHGLGHSVSSSSSSSSSSRSSKSTSSTTTTSQQMAALVAPPQPVVRTVVVHQPVVAPLVAVKSAPIIQVSSGRSNDVSVDVNHHQSGPNYNYGYSIKQRSSEPGTKGLLVGEQVVYSRK